MYSSNNLLVSPNVHETFLLPGRERCERLSFPFLTPLFTVWQFPPRTLCIPVTIIATVLEYCTYYSSLLHQWEGDLKFSGQYHESEMRGGRWF